MPLCLLQCLLEYIEPILLNWVWYLSHSKTKVAQWLFFLGKILISHFVNFVNDADWYFSLLILSLAIIVIYKYYYY